MSDIRQLKASITGLLGFAAAEEQVLLAGSLPGETGDPANWAAAPIVAHNTEFKSQQVHRLTSVRKGHEPEEFAEIDHTDTDVYKRYASWAPEGVAGESISVTSDLIDGLRAATADDLFDPSRHPWLKGRQLWLQIVVRGFWHPTGHLGDYYLAHGEPARAVALAGHAFATARYLGAPDQAAGMAGYNLACTQAKAGRLEEAAAAVRETIALNPGLRAKVWTEPDLTSLRDAGLLESARV